MLAILLVLAIPFAPGNSPIHTPSAPNAWGGQRPETGTLSQRVVDYNIDATLDPTTHTVHGHELLTWQNRSAQPVATVYLHLYLNAFASHRSTMMSEALVLGSAGRGTVDLDDEGFGGITLSSVLQNGQAVRVRFVHPDDGPQSDETVVACDLPQLVPPNGATTLAITFDSLLPKGGDRAGYFGDFHLAGQWFPKIGVLELPGERGATEVRWNVHEYHLLSEFYADFGAFDVRITVPDGFQVAAVGERQGTPTLQDGKRTYHFIQGDVHDFAWMAAREFAPPLTATWRGHVAVEVYFPEEYRAAAERCLALSLLSLDDFSDALMPYPYKTVTCVVPPFNTGASLGGMEYPTFFTADSARRTPPHSLDRYSLDFTTEHEFGHGYFYGIVASNEFEEPFLDEGLNQYWDDRFFDKRGALVDLAPWWLLPFGLGVHLQSLDSARTEVIGDPTPFPDPIAQDAWHRRSTASYGSIYSRTSVVFGMLERRLAPGELERGMRAYVMRWRFRHPSTADLEQVLAENTATPDLVHDTFRDFIYGTTAVDDRVVSVTSHELVPEPSRDKAPAVIDAEVAAARKADKHPYPYLNTVVVERRGGGLPQTLRVTFDDASVETVDFPANESWHRFTWTKMTQVAAAELDPGNILTIDSNRLNNGRTRERKFGALVALCRSVGTWLHILISVLVTV